MARCPRKACKLARTAAERSFVLLKNDFITTRPVLPLASDIQTVALIGPAADDAANMLVTGQPRQSSGCSDAEDRYDAKNWALNTSSMPRAAEYLAASDAQIEEGIAAARASDVAILALGEYTPEMTGEAGSRAHPVLPGPARGTARKSVRHRKACGVAALHRPPACAAMGVRACSRRAGTLVPGRASRPRHRNELCLARPRRAANLR